MNRLLVRIHRDERGVGLVEGLVSSALMAIALTVLVGSLSTFAISSRNAEDRALAQAVARAQAARIKAAPYQANGDYSAYYEALPGGITRAVTVTWWNGAAAWVGTQNANGLQKVALTVNADGNPVATLEFAKAQR
jgi:Tfp pilus assembly protein PilV